MLDKYKIVILHNIISPYKTLLFNELFEICSNLKVLYMAETENNREWDFKRDDFKFPYEVMFKGQLNRVGFLKILNKTWGKLNLLNPEVLIVGGYSYAAYWAGFFWAKLNRRKIILWSASHEEDRGRFFLKEKFKSVLVKRCDAANVYGERNKDYLVKLGMKEDRIFIKGNTTNNDFYCGETMKLKAKREVLCEQFGIPTHNFLYVGRFSQEKNLLCLLEAFKKLETKDFNWGLIFVGNGPQKEEIENYIKKCSMKNVYMPGFKQKDEIPQYLAVSDVFILPSISEPWGLVVNEAMAAGLPVLVSKRCGCYPDLINEGVNGFAFDPFNMEELHGLMKKAAEGKYDLAAMGKASLDIIKNYTPEKAAKVIKETVGLVLNKF